jgi:hypothetical protein
MRLTSVAASSRSNPSTSNRRFTSDKALPGVVSAAHSTSCAPSSSSSSVFALAKA